MDCFFFPAKSSATGKNRIDGLETIKGNARSSVSPSTHMTRGKKGEIPNCLKVSAKSPKLLVEAMVRPSEYSSDVYREGLTSVKTSGEWVEMKYWCCSYSPKIRRSSRLAAGCKKEFSSSITIAL